MKIAAADEVRLAAIAKPWARVLEEPGWRDLTDYVASTFVYVAGYAYQSPVLSVAVARRGHKLSYWYKPPPEGPLSMSVVAWKPRPEDDGVSIYERERWLYGAPENGAYVRPPEPVYKAAGTDPRCRRPPASS